MTLPNRVEDDHLKMAMKRTPKKTTPMKKLLQRGPGLHIYASELTGKMNSKNRPNVKCVAEWLDQGKQVQHTPELADKHKKYSLNKYTVVL